MNSVTKSPASLTEGRNIKHFNKTALPGGSSVCWDFLHLPYFIEYQLLRKAGLEISLPTVISFPAEVTQ